jgi:hypothetical protein
MGDLGECTGLKKVRVGEKIVKYFNGFVCVLLGMEHRASCMSGN